MQKMCKALILAGGLGTRLRSVVSDRPKPMAEVKGRPILEYLIKYFASQGIKDFILSVGYMAKMVISHFGDGKKLGVKIEYCEEKNELGTGGALINAKEMLSDPVIVTNGDTILELDLQRLIKFHEEKKSDWTMTVIKIKHTSLDLVGRMVTDEDGRITAFDQSGVGEWVNGGVYCISSKILAGINLTAPFSLEKDLLPELLRKKAKIYTFKTSGFFTDIGTPQSYKNLCKNGIPENLYLQ